MPSYWYEDLPYSNPFHLDVVMICPNCGMLTGWKRAAEVPETWTCYECHRAVTPFADG